MAPSTYQASNNGIKLANDALKRYPGKSKTYLAGEAGGISRTTVNNFFSGRPVSFDLFTAICDSLGLDWKLIADLNTEEPETAVNPGIDALVQTIRGQISADILERCGKMRILDMEQPIEYGDIYTDVNILEKTSSRSRLEFAEMLAACQGEDFDRFGIGKVQGERLPGLEAVDKYSKLMILGKPGAGKTTFMKRLAMLCSRGDFQGQRVPIFVTLKEFAEAEGKPGILEYIDRQWSSCGITESAKTLLSKGRALVLLDGLDEVRDVDHDRVLRVIKDFAHQYCECSIVITCRIAAREYTFENFTEVEVADFNKEQIAEFIGKWFKTKGDLQKAGLMISKLQDRQPVQELATNPLLLTLLCLIFGEGSDFPSNRSELYKEGLDVLLKKWDGKRNIERDQVYKKLSLKRKEDLLSQLAFDTFDRGEYFFKQSTAERYIANYIQNISGASDDDLQLDSEAVLRSIMAQHGLLVERAKGIFSFSHLTFHEYFAAKRIVDSSIAQGSEAFQTLAGHADDKRWKEVFFLVLGMLPDASSCVLTIKQEIDGILADDQKAQKYLEWLDEKVRSINGHSSTKAYLCYVSLYHDISLPLNLYSSLDNDISCPFYLYYPLSLDLSLLFSLGLSLSSNIVPRFPDVSLFFLDNAVEKSQEVGCNVDFIAILQNLRKQIPEESAFSAWKEQHLTEWRQRMLVAMIQYRNIGHDWQFTKEQQDNLIKYYFANELLHELLEATDECYLTVATRQYIIDTFCRPLHLIPPPPVI
jgi:predicted NACHT family NTPase